jgi:hypothetical protein
MKKLLVALFLITQVPITTQYYKFGKVSKGELEEKFHPLDSAAEAVYFYNCIAVVFFTCSIANVLCVLPICFIAVSFVTTKLL